VSSFIVAFSHFTSAALVAFVGCTFTYTIGKMKVRARAHRLVPAFCSHLLIFLQNVSDSRAIPDVTLDQLQKVRALFPPHSHWLHCDCCAGAAAGHGQRAHQTLNSNRPRAAPAFLHLAANVLPNNAHPSHEASHRPSINGDHQPR
jgi:hypothetical protein